MARDLPHHWSVETKAMESVRESMAKNPGCESFFDPDPFCRGRSLESLETGQERIHSRSRSHPRGRDIFTLLHRSGAKMEISKENSNTTEVVFSKLVHMIFFIIKMYKFRLYYLYNNSLHKCQQSVCVCLSLCVCLNVVCFEMVKRASITQRVSDSVSDHSTGSSLPQRRMTDSTCVLQQKSCAILNVRLYTL